MGTDVVFADFAAADQAEVRDLVLQGLGDHWGTIEAWRNPDLDDIAASYATGRTIVGRDSEGVIATGTVIPRDMFTAQIVRMSVRGSARRTGVGRRVVEQLVDTARRWGIRALIVETGTAWTEVVAFYISCGFSITHTEEGQFGQNTWFEMRLDR